MTGSLYKKILRNQSKNFGINEFSKAARNISTIKK